MARLVRMQGLHGRPVCARFLRRTLGRFSHIEKEKSLGALSARERHCKATPSGSIFD
jgi:hypothetical protein